MITRKLYWVNLIVELIPPLGYMGIFIFFYPIISYNLYDCCPITSWNLLFIYVLLIITIYFLSRKFKMMIESEAIKKIQKGKHLIYRHSFLPLIRIPEIVSENEFSKIFCKDVMSFIFVGRQRYTCRDLEKLKRARRLRGGYSGKTPKERKL